MRRTKSMAMKKNLPQRDIDSITDHLSYTSWFMVMWYNLSQLSALDWVDTRTVKRSGKYIPVRFDTCHARRERGNREAKRPYSVRRVRIDEIKHIYNKRNRRKRLEEEPI